MINFAVTPQTIENENFVLLIIEEKNQQRKRFNIFSFRERYFEISHPRIYLAQLHLIILWLIIIIIAAILNESLCHTNGIVNEDR